MEGTGRGSALLWGRGYAEAKGLSVEAVGKERKERE